MDGEGLDRGGAALAQLSERLKGRGDARLARSVLASVRALHGLIEDLRPSGEELRAAIAFLTAVGHAADERRQEWVLLADVLGASALIEDLSTLRPPGATPNAPAGPFYRDDAPEVPNGGDLSRDGKGEPMTVEGRVRALGGAGVGGATVEVWHANAEGLYENQEPDRQPEFNLRGRMRADDEGRFRFRTVRPGRPRLPDDGPVGRLMTALGLGLERPTHLHFRVTAPGFEPLVTQVFDQGDPLVGRDPLFGVRPELLATVRAADADGGAPRLRLDVAFTLCPSGAAPGAPSGALP